MKKDLIVLIKDENVYMYGSKVSIIPYNRSLLEERDKEYIMRLLRIIIDNKKEIAEYLGVRFFTIMVSYCFIDGLYETNSLLINENSTIEFNW